MDFHLCPPCHNSHLLHTGKLPSGPIPQPIWPQEGETWGGGGISCGPRKWEKGERKWNSMNSLLLMFRFILFVGQKNIIMQPTTTTNGYFQNRHSFVMNNRLAWLSQFTVSFSSREIFPEIFICKFFTLVFPSPRSAARIDVIDKFFYCFTLLTSLSLLLSLDISLWTQFRGKIWKKVFLFREKKKTFVIDGNREEIRFDLLTSQGKGGKKSWCLCEQWKEKVEDMIIQFAVELLLNISFLFCVIHEGGKCVWPFFSFLGKIEGNKSFNNHQFAK